MEKSLHSIFHKRSQIRVLEYTKKHTTPISIEGLFTLLFMLFFKNTVCVAIKL